MTNRFLLIALLSGVSSLAVAQQQTKRGTPAAALSSPLATTTCAATFTSGSGHNATKFCVTENGNIPQFSRGGDEYISVGAFVEGYGICDTTPATHVSYFDYADFDSGNWSASTFTSTATTATSTRTTADGIWKIKIIVAKVPATAQGPGSAKVTMQLTNLTAVPRTAILLRTADFDFMSSSLTDLHNDFDYTLDTAFGLEPGFASGLSISSNTSTGGYSAFADNFGGPDPCTFGNWIASQPFFGDGGIDLSYGIAAPARGTKTVVLTYRPI